MNDEEAKISSGIFASDRQRGAKIANTPAIKGKRAQDQLDLLEEMVPQGEELLSETKEDREALEKFNNSIKDAEDIAEAVQANRSLWQHGRNADEVLRKHAIEIENSIKETPVLLQYLDLAGKIKHLGIPSRDEHRELLKRFEQYKEVTTSIKHQYKAVRRDRNRLARENADLTLDDQEPSQGSTTMQQGLKSSDIALLIDAFDLQLQVEDEEEYEKSPAEDIRTAVDMAKDFRDSEVKPQITLWEKGLAMTVPSQNERLAVQQAFWLFAEIHKPFEDVKMSLSDIHALAVKMQQANMLDLTLALALLHSFIERLSEIMPDDIKQNCGFIFLRSIELLAWHLVRSVDTYRLTIRPKLDDVDSKLREAAKTSKLLESLHYHVTSLVQGQANPVLATSLLASVSEDEIFRKGEYLMIPDGENILIILNNTVHLIRPDQYYMVFDLMIGFHVEIKDFPHAGEHWHGPDWYPLTPTLKKLFEFSLSLLKEKPQFETIPLDSDVKQMNIHK